MSKNHVSFADQVAASDDHAGTYRNHLYDGLSDDGEAAYDVDGDAAYDDDAAYRDTDEHDTDNFYRMAGPYDEPDDERDGDDYHYYTQGGAEGDAVAERPAATTDCARRRSMFLVVAAVVVVVVVVGVVAFLLLRGGGASKAPFAPAAAATATDVDVAALADSDWKVYVADWCGYCKEQRAMIGADYPLTVNCTEPVADASVAAECRRHASQGFPSWVNGRSGATRVGRQTREQLADMARGRV